MQKCPPKSVHAENKSTSFPFGVDGSQRSRWVSLLAVLIRVSSKLRDWIAVGIPCLQVLQPLHQNVKVNRIWRIKVVLVLMCKCMVLRTERFVE